MYEASSTITLLPLKSNTQGRSNVADIRAHTSSKSLLLVINTPPSRRGMENLGPQPILPHLRCLPRRHHKRALLLCRALLLPRRHHICARLPSLRCFMLHTHSSSSPSRSASASSPRALLLALDASPALFPFPCSPAAAALPSMRQWLRAGRDEERDARDERDARPTPPLP